MMNREPIEEARYKLSETLALLDVWLEGDTVGDPWQNRIAEMPVNTNPDHPDLVKRGWRSWPVRGQGDCPAEITGLTIHHMMSHSPLATARYCTNPRSAGGKGCPTVQYHFWVSADDGCPVFLLIDPQLALWHDHTGTFQSTLSIGMAGSLHNQQPPDEQMIACATLCVCLMDLYDLTVEQVQGHKERAWNAARVRTVCPGWDSANWRDSFYEVLKIATA